MTSHTRSSYDFIIASRNIPTAINAPITAPTTAAILLMIMSLPAHVIETVPKNGINPANQRNMKPTSKPIIIKIAPTTLLLPDPKYAVNIPAMTLATANTSINILKK